MMKAERSVESVAPPVEPTMLCEVEDVGGGGTAVLAMKESKSFNWYTAASPEAVEGESKRGIWNSGKQR